MCKVDGSHLDQLEQRIHRINSLAGTTRTQNAAVSVDYVIGVGGHDVERIDEEVQLVSHLAIRMTVPSNLHGDKACISHNPACAEEVCQPSHADDKHCIM